MGGPILRTFNAVRRLSLAWASVATTWISLPKSGDMIPKTISGRRYLYLLWSTRRMAMKSLVMLDIGRWLYFSVLTILPLRSMSARCRSSEVLSFDQRMESALFQSLHLD